MAEYFEHLEQLDDISDVLWYVVNTAKAHGVIRQSYHFTPLFESQNSLRTAVSADGFSPEWVALYEKSDFRKADPIPDRTMVHGTLLKWQDAMAMEPNSRANETYFAAMREHGLIHGFGVPLFGPQGRNAYASFDFGKPIEEVPMEDVGIVRSVAQAAHQRVCILLEKTRERPELSEREREVLHWLARGKSIASIATILDISPDTAKTYCRRIHGKLKASDRVGATVKALKLGLVKV